MLNIVSIFNLILICSSSNHFSSFIVIIVIDIAVVATATFAAVLNAVSATMTSQNHRSGLVKETFAFAAC